MPHRTFWLFLFAALFTVLMYYPGLSGDYMFDDMQNLLDNERLNLDQLDIESLQGAAFSSGSGLLRRPVSMLSFSLNRYFFGIAPYSHKVINLAIHLVTGLCLFFLSRKLVNTYREQHNPHLSDTYSDWLPFTVCALWLIHPLNLTPILYIVQRMTSLAALFTVCGLLLYVTGRQRMLAGKHGLPLILFGLVFCGGLAILSKETGALLPLYMMVLEVTLFRFRGGRNNISHSTVVLFIVAVALPACLCIVFLATNPDYFLGSYNLRDFSLTERLLTEARVLVYYIKLIIIPSITDLGLYHDDISISRSLLTPPTTLYSLASLLALLVGALILLRKRPLVSLGIMWFFAGHLLESTLLPLEIAHEHRNYLAGYGIILAVSSAIAELKMQRLSPAIRKAMPVVIIFLFSFTTWLRAGQWSNNVSHAIYEARHHPDSFRSVYAAGRVHARLALQKQPGSEEQAFIFLDQASELSRADIMPTVIMIKLSYLLDRQVKQVWFERITERLAHYPITPSDLKSLHELTICMEDKCEIPHNIMDEMFRLVLENKSLENTPHLLAEAITVHGYYSINIRGDFLKGLELFRHAVRLDSREPQRWINLINLLTVMGRLDEAEKQLASFEEANTHGGNIIDYHKLQNAIDQQRKENASMTSTHDSANG